MIPKNKVNTNHPNSRKRSSFNISEGLLNINLEKLLTQYYSGDFKDLSMNKMEILFSDFKTTLKLIEDYKINSSQNPDSELQNKKALSEIGKKENLVVSPLSNHPKSTTEANSVNLIEI